MELAELAKKFAPVGAILSCLIYAAQAFGLFSSALHAEYATKADLAVLAARLDTVIELLEKSHGPDQRSRPDRRP